MKFQEIETGFFRWKSTNNNDINIFLSLDHPCTFFLAKEKTWKRIFNTNSELLQNRTEKQIMSSKITINWPFNDIWCYLFIASLDSKIYVFQKTVVRVYYILNDTHVEELLFYWENSLKHKVGCFRRFSYVYTIN